MEMHGGSNCMDLLREYLYLISSWPYFPQKGGFLSRPLKNGSRWFASSIFGYWKILRHTYTSWHNAWRLKTWSYSTQIIANNDSLCMDWNMHFVIKCLARENITGHINLYPRHELILMTRHATSCTKRTVDAFASRRLHVELDDIFRTRYLDIWPRNYLQRFSKAVCNKIHKMFDTYFLDRAIICMNDLTFSNGNHWIESELLTVACILYRPSLYALHVLTREKICQ